MTHFENWLSVSQAGRAAEVSSEAIRQAAAQGKIRVLHTPLGRLYSRVDAMRLKELREKRLATAGAR